MTKAASVLVVDDSQGICDTMSMILRRKGFEVACAADGERALEIARSQAFDVAIVDIRLPGIDGVEVSRKLLELRPGSHVTVMTAYAVADKVHRAIELGVERVFYKPLDMDELITYVIGAGVRGESPSRGD